MDWLTFIAEVIKAVAWPIAAIAIALIFREQIRSLLVRMKKGKVGPAEFEFEQGVRELQAETRGSAGDEARETELEPLKLAAEPRKAVLEAFLGVESALQALARSKGMYAELAQHELYEVARLLEQRGSLESRQVSLYRDLRHLRNQAAHELDFTPSVEAILDYAKLARRLEMSIRKHVEP